MSEHDNEYDIIELNCAPIELFKIFKIAGLTSGGQGKMLIDEGLVYVNGELETRKRARIYHHDVIAFDDYTWRIQSLDQVTRPADATPNMQNTKQNTQNSKRRQRPKLG